MRRRKEIVLPVIDEWSIRKWQADDILDRELRAAIDKHTKAVEEIEAERCEKESG
jgi:hypothetical protein